MTFIRIRQLLGAFTAAVVMTAGAAASAAEPSLDNLKASHPRLVFTPALEASLKARLKTDPLLAQFVDKVRQRSDAIAASPPVVFRTVPFEKFGIQMLVVSRETLERVIAHGLLYRITGEPKYAKRLEREVDTALAFPTWNPAHFLDAAEMLTAMAFAYDWAYDAWTPAQRATLREAMKTRAIDRGLEIYETHSGLSGMWTTSTSNWNSVSNAGLLAASLAMAEDEPEIARRVLKYAVPSLAYPKSAYEPDGGVDEGPTYWGYGTDFYCLAAAMLQSALGSDAGLLDGKGIARTSLYRLHVQGPNGRVFSYADAWPGLGPSIAYAILSSRFGPAPARQQVRELANGFLDQFGRDAGNRIVPLVALWLPTAENAAALQTEPLDAFFGGTAELSMFRSAWGDKGAAYLGFKAGHADHNHNHLDLGSFVFDQAQVRWSADLGPDDYGLPGYFRKETDVNNPLTAENAHLPNRWSYFRLINTGHSTLTLGGDLQSRTAVAPVIAKGSSAARAFTVADLSTVYPGRATGWQRGIALIDRRWVAVRDELHGLQPEVPVEWVLITEARVESIAADGRSARLSKNGQTLLLRLDQAPAAARISAAPARPKTAAEDQNRGITRVTVSWKADSADAVLEVHLVPDSVQGQTPGQGALVDWKP